MLYLITKALISGALIALVSEISKRNPGFGGLIASLPLVSVIGMMWLWRDTHDPVRLSAHALGTLWFVIPSLPMFILIGILMKHGVSFWLALGAGCALTVALYALMTWLAPHVGIRL